MSKNKKSDSNKTLTGGLVNFTNTTNKGHLVSCKGIKTTKEEKILQNQPTFLQGINQIKKNKNLSKTTLCFQNNNNNNNNDISSTV